MSDTNNPPGKPLPNDDDIQREPVFYYSREHRLNRASPYVREMNEGKYTKPGLTKRFFGSKSNLVLFATILVIVASLTIGSRFSKREQNMKLGENTVGLAIIQQEGTLILNIVKKAGHSGRFYTGAVDIVVSPANSRPKDGEGMKAFSNRIVFNPVESETYRISLPFEGSDFNVNLRTEDEQKSIRVKVKKIANE